MIDKNTITLINHASVLITGNNYGLLCDPWYSGSVFHNGWSLLYENPINEILEIIDKTSFIWISHEHPDHFSIEFFRNYKKEIIDKNISIIFQETKDHRVANFILSCGINLIELKEGKVFKIEDEFTLEIEKSDFYDSLAIIRLNGVNIFNINDCPLRAKSEIVGVKKRHGKCDILFTQFSYAAWKGGKENIDWRRKAAAEKIATMNLQANLLEADILIPFASFIRFSNVFNNYLNKDANTPKKLMEYYIKKPLASTKVLLLSPMSKFKLKDINLFENNYDGTFFWENQKLKNQNLYEYANSFDISDLITHFEGYLKRLKKNNNFHLIKIISKLPYFQLFSKINFFLVDIKKIITIDIPNESLFISTDEHWDISLHSESLLFILKYQYGFDTLTINACFEVSSNLAFKKFCKAFAIENMNNIGYSINFSSLFSFAFLKLGYLFITKLRLQR